MSRRMDAPVDFECPYRHSCPHLDTLSTTWVMEVYQESFELRERLHRLEIESQQQIDQLHKTLLERDQTIAQLRLQHQKQFKANVKPAPTPIAVKVRRRGAPRGHPPWRRRQPSQIDQVIHVDAPSVCPHCQCDRLLPSPQTHEHVQEDIVLTPRPRAVKFVHRQGFCPRCRRDVYQTAPGEMRNCPIGPITRAVAADLRYNLQIPYRKVQYILRRLFGMTLVHATAMNFDRKTTALARPLHQQLQVMLQSADVAYADETSWRQDGRGHYVWFGGNEHLSVYHITDNRSCDSAVQLLGEQFDGTLISDDYASYNAVESKRRQTCWNHLRTAAREVAQQIELADATARMPLSVEFCHKLQRFALRMCELGQKLRKNKLARAKAIAMIPNLQRQLRRFAGKKLEHPAAETLRLRLIQKDWDKLFTFLRVKGVEPTNNLAERALRLLVIMRKICFGTRSAAGSESHAVLASVLQTARKQGKEAIEFVKQLLTEPTASAKAALFASGP